MFKGITCTPIRCCGTRACRRLAMWCQLYIFLRSDVHVDRTLITKSDVNHEHIQSQKLMAIMYTRWLTVCACMFIAIMIVCACIPGLPLCEIKLWIFPIRSIRKFPFFFQPMTRIRRCGTSVWGFDDLSVFWFTLSRARALQTYKLQSIGGKNNDFLNRMQWFPWENWRFGVGVMQHFKTM